MRQIFPALLLLAALPLPLVAERYAVLIGVGQYQNGITPLEGPRYDVQAMRDLLLRTGYNPRSVTILIDQQATRAGILDALKATVSRMAAGDHLLLYYSGHGTSAFDQGLQWLSPEIGPDSGAIATYDLALSSLQAAVGSLVIGRRDLRPILSKIPQGAQALVVLDACYSENSAKNISVFRFAPTRGINLVDVIAPSADTAGASPPKPPAGGAPEGGAYPYANVVALAAASKSQPALDISSETMRRKPDWRTVDGQPHGALTNSLLAALMGRGDTNHDGVISYDELFRSVRRDMEKYPHQPQLLSASAFRLDQPALGGGAAKVETPRPQATAAAPAAASGIRVFVDDPSPALAVRLRGIPGIELASTDYEIMVRRKGNEWGLYDRSGVLMLSVPLEPVDAVVARVRAQVQVAQLRSWTNPSQGFNVRIDAEPAQANGYDKFRTAFRVGEKVRFRISTEKPAYLLLLGIDKNGRVTVLFPGPPEGERNVQPAGKNIDFVVQVTPPAGSEQLKLIGFGAQPERWMDWTCSANACPEFDPSDARMVRLMQLLRGSSNTAETSLRVISQEQ
jgi:hypothetical protein